MDARASVLLEIRGSAGAAAAGTVAASSSPSSGCKRETVAGVGAGPIDKSLAAALERLVVPPKTVFVCATNAFVETATELLLALGVAADTIRTERYGG